MGKIIGTHISYYIEVHQRNRILAVSFVWTVNYKPNGLSVGVLHKVNGTI